MKRFEEEQLWLGNTRLKVEGRGNSEFYDHKTQQVIERKESWEHLDVGGEFSSDELTRLIQTAHSLLDYIATQKALRSSLPT